MRIKGVRTLYLSGAATFPQFSACNRNLSCYPRPKCLQPERLFMSQKDHVPLWSTPGVSTVEALMRISINGVSAEH